MDRIETLTLALQYDSYGEKYLTDFDRMFIHKAISAEIQNREHHLPEWVEKKIKPKLEYIIKKNWQSPY